MGAWKIRISIHKYQQFTSCILYAIPKTASNVSLSTCSASGDGAECWTRSDDGHMSVVPQSGGDPHGVRVHHQDAHHGWPAVPVLVSTVAEPVFRIAWSPLINWTIIDQTAAGRACVCRTAWTRAGMATTIAQAAVRSSVPTRTRGAEAWC